MSVRLNLALVLFLVLSGSRDPVITAAQTPPAASCRVAPTVFTTSHANSDNPAFHGTTAATCSFVSASLTFNCTIQYSDSTGFSSTINSSAVYKTLDDILAETTVIPPLRRLATVSSRTTAPGQMSGTTTFAYDALHRLTKEVAPSTTTTYSGWDAAGRPKTARAVGTKGGGWEIGYTYNDAARTQTITNVQMGFTTTCVQSFDANGNPVSSVCTSTAPGAGRTTATTRITATERICR